MTRSFEVAVGEVIDPDAGDEPFNFHFSDDPDRELVIFPPTEGQVLQIMAMRGMDEDEVEEQTSLVREVLLSMFDRPSRRYVERRLISREKPLSFSTLFRVFQQLTEEIAGRPTESSPASTASRPTTGKPSTGRARRAGSTRSTSRSTGSATSSTGGRSNGSKAVTSSTES